MIRALTLAILVCMGCAACASTSMRDAGHYDRTRYVYQNDQAGVRFILPPPWLVRTERHRFTVPLALRPDQVQVLEAYHTAANLGLVAVVQTGPVAEIGELVQRMQAVPEARLHGSLPSLSARDIRQRFVGKVGINGHDAAAWIYTATDIAGGQPIEMTVSFYILKIRQHYVYLTFSTPAETYENAQPVMEAVLRTVTLSIDRA